MTLDEWSDDEIDAMIEVLEETLLLIQFMRLLFRRDFQSPGPDASHEERSKFIRLVMI